MKTMSKYQLTEKEKSFLTEKQIEEFLSLSQEEQFRILVKMLRMTKNLNIATRSNEK